MFRSIEGVYKADRSLLSVSGFTHSHNYSNDRRSNQRLKEIGTNPSSPKALGDLLMRWVRSLDGVATTSSSCPTDR